MRAKILLLQARRADDPALAGEVRAFAAKLDVPAERVVPHNLLTGPPTWTAVRAHDVLMVGGSGEYYVSAGNLPRFEALLDLMREVVAVGYPTYASCFGFQCLVQALGGEIVRDDANAEIGTSELWLTAEGRADPLLGALPATFMAQVGHRDRAERFPESARNLAASERCDFQALRVPGVPLWASQFHPEMDVRENRARYLMYARDYSGEMEIAEILEQFAESTRAVSLLLPRFVRMVLE